MRTWTQARRIGGNNELSSTEPVPVNVAESQGLSEAVLTGAVPPVNVTGTVWLKTDEDSDTRSVSRWISGPAAPSEAVIRALAPSFGPTVPGASSNVDKGRLLARGQLIPIHC